jgi:hypothetical protein
MPQLYVTFSTDQCACVVMPCLLSPSCMSQEDMFIRCINGPLSVEGSFWTIIICFKLFQIFLNLQKELALLTENIVRFYWRACRQSNQAIYQICLYVEAFFINIPSVFSLNCLHEILVADRWMTRPIEYCLGVIGGAALARGFHADCSMISWGNVFLSS